MQATFRGWQEQPNKAICCAHGAVTAEPSVLVTLTQRQASSQELTNISAKQPCKCLLRSTSKSLYADLFFKSKVGKLKMNDKMEVNMKKRLLLLTLEASMRALKGS
jgi:hypothetical protein